MSAGPERAHVEARVLAGDDKPRHDAPRQQRIGNGVHLDRFGPGADHQPNVGETQPSP